MSIPFIVSVVFVSVDTKLTKHGLTWEIKEYMSYIPKKGYYQISHLETFLEVETRLLAQW